MCLSTSVSHMQSPYCTDELFSLVSIPRRKALEVTLWCTYTPSPGHAYSLAKKGQQGVAGVSPLPSITSGFPAKALHGSVCYPDTQGRPEPHLLNPFGAQDMRPDQGDALHGSERLHSGES